MHTLDDYTLCITFLATNKELSIQEIKETVIQNVNKEEPYWFYDMLGVDKELQTSVENFPLFRALNRALFSEMSILDKSDVLSNFFDLGSCSLEQCGSLYDILEFAKDRIEIRNHSAKEVL